MVNREVIGIVSGIDKPDGNVERVTRWLKLAGCKKVFPVSSITGEGIKELADFLNDDEDKKPTKPIVKKPTVQKKAEPKKNGQLETWLL